MLLLGDCLERMGEIPDGAVDMVLCDLPYGTTACKWDSVIPFEPLWAHYWRLLKPTGAILLTAAQPFTSALVMSQPERFRDEWVWHKNSGSNFANAARQPLREHESVLVFSTGITTYNPQRRQRLNERSEKATARPIHGSSRGQHVLGLKPIVKQYDPASRNPGTVLQFDSVANAGGHKLHPTQKPVALMEYLIRTYTNEGDTVLDNTMGSGTTGVACANTGRKFIGIERDPTYFAIAERRIAEAQSTLFAA
jgi:DNA modification methylase